MTARHSLRRLCWLCQAPCLAILLLILATARDLPALTIIRQFSGGARGSLDLGSGNLADIFNTAADVWELAILDDFVLTLHFGWGAVGGAEHTLNSQGGTPNRETDGTILFNNDNDVSHIHFYLDPTPWDNTEYSTWIETSSNWGGGIVNAARYFADPSGEAASFTNVDLFMVALHEIGHALGLSSSNRTFIVETADHDVDVISPLPFAGTTIKLQTNAFGVIPHIEVIVYGTLMSGNNQRERRLPSAVDILAAAQLSQFRKLNLDLAPRLKTQRIGTNLVVLWREIRPGTYILQQNTNLTQTNGWTSVAQTIVVSNGIHTVTLPLTSGPKFLRLKD